jgi:hypothetical protein
VRKQPFFETDQKDDWKLQPFRLMQRNARDGVALFLKGVDVGDQRNLFEEGRQLRGIL